MLYLYLGFGLRSHRCHITKAPQVFLYFVVGRLIHACLIWCMTHSQSGVPGVLVLERLRVVVGAEKTVRHIRDGGCCLSHQRLLKPRFCVSIQTSTGREV